MFKKDTRRGLALGAAFSLVASLFGAAPAALADETSVVVAPFAGTSNTMLITEDFIVKTRLGNDQDSSKINNLKYYIEKPAGYELSISNTVSSTAISAFDSTFHVTTMTGADTDSVVVPTGPSTTAVNQLRVQLWSASNPTSISAAVAVKITAFLDIDPDGVFDTSEPHESYTVNFVPWSTFGASVNLTTPVVGAQTLSATAAVSGVNIEQLNGQFDLQFVTTYDSQSSISADLKAFAADGNMSGSQAVSTSAPADASVSATLFYDQTNDGTLAAGEALVIVKKGYSAATIEGVTVSPVAGANLVATSPSAADSRLGSTFALKAWAYTGSTAVAGKVPTFTVTTAAVVLSADKYLVINGTTFTQSSVLNNKSMALTAGSDGKGTITIQTVGFSTTEALTVALSSENRTGTYAVTPRAILFSVSSAVPNLVAQAGAATTVVFNVVDQFGETPATDDQTVVFSIAGDAATTSTQSVAVVSGVASVTVTPKSATATGSYVITPNLLYTDRDGNDKADNDSVIATTVFVKTDIEDNEFTVEPAQATYSASISYGVNLSYSADITVNVAQTGSSVVISSPGLIIHSGTASASDTLTVVAGTAGVVTFKATSRMAGTYTVSLVSGTATASTQIVVAAAAHDAGAAISYDVSELLVGKSSNVTGTLVDANGNPVATGDTASIVVAWTGGGLPFNLPTTTDADGEFTFQVLVLATETGQAAVSVTYRPNGAAVDTDNLSFATAIDLVSSLTPVAGDQKVNAGSFKGYVAVYARGYEGQRLSAKIGKDWVIVDPIVNNQENGTLFRVTDFTGAGVDIAVRIYIDRVLIDTINLTTK